MPPASLLRHFNKTDDHFWAVAATSARNVWVFGLEGKYLRLSGSRWTYGQLPHSKKLTMIVISAKAFSPADSWAFGCQATNLGSADARCVPTAVHFNGHRWVVLKVPGKGVIWQVSAISPSDIWAIDGPSVISATGSRPRLLHWNGATWQVSPNQPKLPKGTQLAGVAATSDTDLWIGGNVIRPKSKARELALHWNGRSWLTAKPPRTPSGGQTSLDSLTPDGNGGIYALSFRTKGGADFSTVISHYSAGRWLAPSSMKWLLFQLAEIPGTTSTWGVGEGPTARLAVGLIVLQGPTPR